MNARCASSFAIDLSQGNPAPLLPDHQPACATIAGPEFDHGSRADLLKVGKLEVAGASVRDPESPGECVDHVIGNPQGGFFSKPVLFSLFALGGEFDRSIWHRPQAGGCGNRPGAR